MESKVKGYHNLLICVKVKSFILQIYSQTEQFPKHEMFGLTSQLRRASLSVYLNIIEGDRRSSRKEFLHFLDIADGSLTETEACLEIAFELGYLSKDNFEEVTKMRKEISYMLIGLIKAIKKSL